jgi:hypothetical protein
MSTPFERVTAALTTRLDDDVLAFVDPETDVMRESRASASDLRALVAVVEADVEFEAHHKVQPLNIDGSAPSAWIEWLTEANRLMEKRTAALRTATRPRGEGEGDRDA